MSTQQLALIGDSALAPVNGAATHVVFILDRSGSMHGKEADVIGGVNSYIAGLRHEPGAVGISYVRFDTEVEIVWRDLPLADVPEMTGADYQPRGSTALLDAVGTMVSAIQNNPEHTYIVLTHTDGLENASREWDRPKVKELIEQRTALDNWTFSFFGCDIDAWGEAGGMGMAAGNVMRFDANKMGDTYAATMRTANVMRKKGMRSTRDYARAAEAADRGASEEEIEKILEGQNSKPE